MIKVHTTKNGITHKVEYIRGVPYYACYHTAKGIKKRYEIKSGEFKDVDCSRCKYGSWDEQ